MIVLLLVVGHWYLSLFCQSFFLHRYAAHRMFKLSKFNERLFFFITYLAQGTSFLNPRAYAILHRMHHTYSDTEKDPHSPIHHRNIFALMWHTKKVYTDVMYRHVEVEAQFEGGYPTWPAFERFADSWISRVMWMGIYTATYIYVVPAGEWWWYGFLPLHFMMGPAQGAVVNWFGHRVGYSNFNNHDHSRNTLIVDFLGLGELFQNNHHKFPLKPNFGVKWFEFDPTYFVIRILGALGLVQLRHARVSADRRPERPAR